MNQPCNVTFQVADIQVALEWYRSNFRADATYVGKSRALLRLEDVSIALVLRGAPAPDMAFGQGVALIISPINRTTSSARLGAVQ